MVSFRLKTIIGVAAIEACLLLLLISSSLGILTDANERELIKRGEGTAKLFAASTKDAVLSTDLARLEAYVGELLSTPGIQYVRVVSAEGRVLAEGGDPAILGRPFVADQSYVGVDDGTFDVRAPIAEAGASFGGVELGLDVQDITATIDHARREQLALAGTALVLSALFSWVLGTYLTRQITGLRYAAEHVQSGRFSHRIAIHGKDELAETARAFNRMTERLDSLYNSLRLKEEQLSEAIEAIPGGFALFDAEDRLVMSNRRYRTTYANLFDILVPGVTVETILRTGVERGVFVDPSGDGEAWIQERLRDRREPLITRERQLFDGRWIQVSDRRTPRGWSVGIRTDITWLKEQEAELKAAKDAAERASRARSSFLAMMSHEIRTPMNGVVGTIDLLLDSPLDAKQAELAEIAQRSAQDLLTLLNDILDISKADAGEMRVEAIPFALEPLARSALEVFGASARSKGLALHLDLDDAARCWVAGDPGRLRQILHNLVGNAIKFTESGSVELRVEREGNESFRFSVADTGIGIDPANKQTLFREFTQLDDSYSRRFGGTGLGLAISKKLVDLMDGDIGVDSAAGGGSKFWFVLPLPLVDAPRPEDPLHTLEPRKEGAATAADFSAHRVLLAEDSETNRMLVIALLKKSGITVDTAGDGFEVLELLQRQHYDLILMDVSMPNLDGIQTTVMIRAMAEEAAENLPIIALTAHSLAGDRDRCLAAGMNDYMTKPVTGAKLIEMLDRWLPSEATAAARIPEDALGQSNSAAAPRDAAILNSEILGAMRAEVGDTAMLSLVRIFLGELPRLMAAIEAASPGDVTAIGLAAHTLKGSAGTLGAMTLRNLAHDLQIAASQEDAATVERLVSKLEGVAEECRVALEKYAESLVEEASVTTKRD